MECSLPMDGRRVSLTQLSKDSFRECQATLTLTDLLIIIFSGISVSVVAIMTSFFLASTVHCFQRWSKGTKGDEEESEEWLQGGGQCGPGTSNNERTLRTVCATCDEFHAASSLVNVQDCLTVGSCPGTVSVVFSAHGHQKCGNKGLSQGMSQSSLLHVQNGILEIVLLAVRGPVVVFSGYWLLAWCFRPAWK